MTDDRKDDGKRTPSWQLPQERQPDTDAYHIWTPRPLLRSIYWKPDPAPPPDAVSSTYEVFIDQRAWLTMHEHVWQAPAEKTPFGYLVGDLCEDPNANRRFINVTAALPARFDFNEDAREQITREATLALQLEVERRRGVLAGWYHRHLGGPVSMSESDVRTHHQHFSEPWHCAFVFVGGGDRCEGGCFRSSPEQFAGDLPLPLYEMASNESLLARGVKRSFVDWSNYTTVDEIRSEPPPRRTLEAPEPPADEGEEPEDAAEGLQIAPFDADPDAEVEDEPTTDAKPVTEAGPSEAAESESVDAVEAPEKAAERAIDEPAVEDEVAEEDEAGADVEAAEEDEPAADVEPAEVDLEAAMNQLTPARIELDLETDEELLPEEGPDADVVEAAPAVPADREGAGAEVADDERDEADPADTERKDTGSEAPAEPEEATAPVAREAVPRKKAATGPGPGAGAWFAERKGIVAGVAGALVLAVAVGAAVMMWPQGGPSASGETDAGAEATETAPPEGGPAAANGAVAPGDSVEAPDVSVAEVDSAGRDMLAAISRFYGRAVARDNGDATCQELADAFIAVENAWIAYNTNYKAEFEGPLPEALAERDERLYAGIQDAEREYELSGCPRP